MEAPRSFALTHACPIWCDCTRREVGACFLAAFAINTIVAIVLCLLCRWLTYALPLFLALSYPTMKILMKRWVRFKKDKPFGYAELALRHRLGRHRHHVHRCGLWLTEGGA